MEEGTGGKIQRGVHSVKALRLVSIDVSLMWVPLYHRKKVFNKS